MSRPRPGALDGRRSRTGAAGSLEVAGLVASLWIGALGAISFTVLGCARESASAGAATAGRAAAPGDVEVSAEGPAESGARGSALNGRVRFVDVTAEVGLDFVHRTGSAGSYPMPAIMGGGAAVLDYDGDDRLDVYLVQGGDRFPPGGGLTGLPNRLFRQQEDGRFADVTEGSGAGHRGYGMGAAAADADNDGDMDLFVTNWGGDVLLRNEGDGTFRDVTAEAGVAGDGGWSTSAVWSDFDRDGLLDLFVARYVDFDPRRECALEGGRTDYCGPAQFRGLPDRVYRNLGGGRFADVSRDSGVASIADAGLGAVALDFDRDGWRDLYVANDADPNHLWRNQGDFTFVEEAIVLGAAFNRYGVPEAGMGVVAGDVDGDLDLDLFVTHLVEETNTLYENRGAAGFEDSTAPRGLALPSVSYTGFGDAFADLDCDGDLDLAVVNGAVKRRTRDLAARADWPWSAYAEPGQLFENRGDGRFVDASAGAGAFTATPAVSRGLVAADLDRDGDLDLLVTAIGGRVRLYRNDGGNALGWIVVRLHDPRLRRDAIGAEVVVVTASRRLLRQVSLSDGYLTSGPAAVHFGLGDEERVERFEVRWPDGAEETFRGAAARQEIELRRGEGETRATSSGAGR